MTHATIRLRILPVIAGFAILGACADPLADVERLSDVHVAEGAGAAMVAPGATDQSGAPLVVPTLFENLFGPATGAVAPTPDGSVDAAENGDATDDIGAEEAAGPVLVSATTPRPGFFAGLLGSGSAPQTATPVSATAAPAQTGIAPGTTVPYGVIATVCGIDAAALGRAVESGSGYTIYDTDPTSTAPRTQYITGFADDCARQFTASLVMFGDIGTHELVRYSAVTSLPYTATDTAYETIKASYCGVAPRAPCGGRIDALSSRTTFLTVYESFGTDDGWADVLLSDGQVIAADF